MLNIGYAYISAKNEDELMQKLAALQMKTGYTYQIINIYPKGKLVYAWYYANRIKK